MSNKKNMERIKFKDTKKGQFILIECQDNGGRYYAIAQVESKKGKKVKILSDGRNIKHWDNFLNIFSLNNYAHSTELIDMKNGWWRFVPDTSTDITGFLSPDIEIFKTMAEKQQKEKQAELDKIRTDLDKFQTLMQELRLLQAPKKQKSI